MPNDKPKFDPSGSYERPKFDPSASYTSSEPAAAPAPPTMQAAEPPTMGQRISDVMHSPIPGFSEKSPAEIGTELMKGGAEAVGTVLPFMLPGTKMGAGALAGMGTAAGSDIYHGRMPSLGRLAGAGLVGAVTGPALGKIFGGHLPNITISREAAPAAEKAVEVAEKEVPRMIMTPEEVAAYEQRQRLAQRLASERGMRSAAWGAKGQP